MKTSVYDQEMPSWATAVLAKDMHQAQTNQLKLYVRAVIESEVWPTVLQIKRKP